MNACLIPGPQVAGRQVVTIEGMAQDTALDPLQRALVDHGAIQCGFCTPGLVMSAKALLANSCQLTCEQAREGLAGNLCRCTGYTKIMAAVLAAGR
ncbi:MAG: hypothetical protein HY692_00365 [Cyanobacteria bacterium NC_groundwater_1444_Ag_S-0.65um_54_12]|nr:hypothetical protein [Cyanobacteria bacterium NC_groundwater_1444_Ag_S-0.65um_54_12]